MKLQRSTGILLGVAIASVTTVAIIETTKNSQSNKSATLYDFAEADISAFTIEREDTTLAFTKTDDTWQMTAPEKTPADPASVAFLLNIITSDTIKESVSASPDQLGNYGLEDPTAVVDLTVDDQNYTLAMGGEDFSGTSLYVVTTDVAAVSDESIEVHLISKGLDDGINRPLDSWILKDDDNQPLNNDAESSQDTDIKDSNESESNN